MPSNAIVMNKLTSKPQRIYFLNNVRDVVYNAQYKNISSQRRQQEGFILNVNTYTTVPVAYIFVIRQKKQIQKYFITSV